MDQYQPARRAEAPGQSAPSSGPATTKSPGHMRPFGSAGRLLAALLIVLVVLGILAVGGRMAKSFLSDSAIKTNEFQALFMTNGQVYFGKLSHVDSDYVKLTNIFYLQVQQTVQPSSGTSSNSNQQQVSLAKLGSELHGPEDVMYVAHTQVLFWENLKNDGKVAQAIQQYQATKK